MYVLQENAYNCLMPQNFNGDIIGCPDFCQAVNLGTNFRSELAAPIVQVALLSEPDETQTHALLF